MTSDLFLAILAMDAYNRTGGGSTVGLALPNTTGIGTATLDLKSEDLPSGFFAQSYIWNGQKVISYRGTDTPFLSAEFNKDVNYGWTTGAGLIDSRQADLAAQFFQLVVGNGSTSGLTLNDLYAANVALTGHSMGGGLAGLIATIYGQQYASLFDPMRFALAATNLISAVNYGVVDEFGNVIPRPDLKDLYFLGSDANASIASGIGSYSIQGQALSTILGAWAGAPSTTDPLDLGFSGILGDYQRHSQSLLVIRMYADQTANVGTDWLAASQFVLPKLFDDSLADALGLLSGNSTGTGTDDAAGKLRTKIAYSAIDDGTFIYGNTGIRALYDDASELGRIIVANGTAEYLKDPGVLKAIGDIIAEYAGLLANNKDIITAATIGNTGHEKGVLYYDEGGSRLVADFSRQLWQITDGPKLGEQADIIGKKTLTDAASSFGTQGSSSSVDDAIHDKWDGSTSHIVKMVAATNDVGTTLDVVNDAHIDQDENALPDDGAMLVGGGGDDTLTGWNGKDLLIGGKGDDTLIGGGGDDLMFGGAGDDTFQGYDDEHPAPENTQDVTGYKGNDWIDGGSGNDTVDYSNSTESITLTLSADNPRVSNTITVGDPGTGGTSSADGGGINTIEVNNDGTGGDDVLASIEKVVLSDKQDIVIIKPFDGQYYASSGSGDQSVTLIDMGDEPEAAQQNQAAGDTLDFSQYGHGIYMKAGTTPLGDGYELYSDAKFKDATGLLFTNVEYIVASNSNDEVDIRGDGHQATSLAKATDDSADSTGALRIDLGGGNDTLKSAPWGTTVDTGDGADQIWLADGIGITDLSGDDRLSLAGMLEFHGGTRYMWSESPWATAFGGLFKSEINSDGELVIETAGIGTTFVLNWAASGGMDTPFAQRPGQISEFEYDIGVYRLIDPNKPSNMTQMGAWDLMGAIVKANFGVPIWKGVDPLTLDLDGDGVEMTAQSTVSPRFDMDGDGYAERTAWIKPDDGILVRDLNGNGKIDNITEMFGGTQSGFSALATLDGNSDGKVDASDNGLADFNGDGVVDANDTIASVEVWRDLNSNAVTDPGELYSLADLGVASISVQGTAQDHVFVAGNQVAETGIFTRIDGTTGTIDDILYSIDNVNTQYTGEPITIAAIAATLPELRSSGTLVSLREAMSLDPALVATIDATLPQMSSLKSYAAPRSGITNPTGLGRGLTVRRWRSRPEYVACETESAQRRADPGCRRAIRQRRGYGLCLPNQQDHP